MTTQRLPIFKQLVVLVFLISGLLAWNIAAPTWRALATTTPASCTPSGTYGTDTFDAANTPPNPIVISSAGAYHVWVRAEVPSVSSSSPLLLNIDSATGTNCYAVPGSAFTTAYTSTQSAWVWVDATAGLTAPTLTQANHKLVVTGTQNGAALDSIEFLSDPNCNPNTTNCTPAVDTTPPTVSLSAPANNATVSGTTTVIATASDNVAVASVQFRLDGANLGSVDTTSPYSYAWNTTTATNASHILTAIATDTSGNTTTAATVTVTVNNSTTTIVGDLDGDGHVTGHDLSIFLAHYGTNYVPAEFDGVTIVEAHDLSILLSNYGK